MISAPDCQRINETLRERNTELEREVKILREELALLRQHMFVDPQAYVEDVLTRISTTPARRIRDLTPWGWAAARAAEPQPAS